MSNYLAIKGLFIIRCLYTCKQSLIRKLALEDKFAHNFMKKSTNYSASLSLPLQVLREDLFVSEISDLQICYHEKHKLKNSVLTLQKTCEYEQINSNIDNYVEIFMNIYKDCNKFNKYEVLYTMHYLQCWNNKNDGVMFTNIWQCMDQQCINLLPHWTINEIFICNDLLFNLGLSRYAKFPIHSLKYLSDNAELLTPANLVQFMFVLNTCRSPIFELSQIEHYLNKCINKLTIDEVGIVAMGFFKSQIQIKNVNLLMQIIHKFLDNIDIINNIALVAIIKILRFSNISQKLVLKVQLLIESLVPKFQNYPLTCLMHISHMSAHFLILNKSLMAAISKRYNAELKKARLKDIERITFTLFTFNYNPKKTPLYQRILNELREPGRTAEIKKYPQSLVHTLQFMVQVNLYPEDLLIRIMDRNFINRLCNSNISKLDRGYLLLDQSISIEMPNYSGPRLSDHLRHFIAKKTRINESYSSNQHRMILDVVHTCKRLFKSRFVAYTAFILPHFGNPYVLVCVDSNNMAYDISNKMLSCTTAGRFKPKPLNILPHNARWLVFVMGTSTFFVKGTGDYTGVAAAQLRHLKHIGYTPIVIPYIDWLKLNSANEKQAYIFSAINK